MKHLLLTTIAAVMVGCGNPEADRALLDAAKKGNIETVKQHLADGADVNAKSKFGRTPLHHAAVDGRKEIAELLIAQGADVNAKTESGWNPLHRAALDGHKEIAELLITKGADVNAKDNYDYTPLHKAALALDGSKEVVELLIAKGADVNAKDEDGRTPLDLANKTETADLLRKHGGKHGTIEGAASGGDIEAVKEFLATGTDVNAKNFAGLTPLHWAASGGHKEIVELLITAGADVNAKDEDGDTPLDNAKYKPETADLLRKHGGKTGEELKAEGK